MPMTFELKKEQAIRLFGSQARLAEELGVTRSAVCQWKHGEPIPEQYALRIRFILKPEAFERPPPVDMSAPPV